MPELPVAPLGLHLASATTARAAVFAAHASAVSVALLDPDGSGGLTERTVPLQRARHGVWSGLVEGVGPGQRYGLRVDGPWDPRAGMRHDPAKLLVDPYGRGVEGSLEWVPQACAHVVDPETMAPVVDEASGAPARSGLDSLGHVPCSVLLEAADAGSPRVKVPWDQTVVYEAHVRGLTMSHPDVPRDQRGTYAALGHPAVIEHLTSLGVTSIELLPIHAIVDEPALLSRGRQNYWGYSTLSYLAPEPRYATAAAREAGAGAVCAELRAAIDALHAAGLEVILDVVYNHTCEGGGDGPSLSFRGIDSASYYRLDDEGHDVDSTGCGNSLDFSHPRVVALTLDSLRHWVEAYGVDGFRFDLAPTLGRGPDGGYSPQHPFLVACAADPVLSDVKLIAEPWDLGHDGWRTGDFPAPWAEWNDRFRDAARDFWLADARRLTEGHQPGHGVAELATRLSGSADMFGRGDRGPLASVNFITAHDGFTLADACAYEHKHNEANGEDNRDGTTNNRSWNHGEEGWHPPHQPGDPGGPTGSAGPHGIDPDSALRDHLRRRSMRNMLATVTLSAGIPMITAGEESGRSQGGNNNPYCLDSPVSWVGWALAPWQKRLLASTTELLRLRRAYPQLRPVRAPSSDVVDPDGTTERAWFDADGHQMSGERWDDPHARVVQMFCHGAPSGERDAVLLVVNGGLDDTDVTLPGAPWGTAFTPLWSSGVDRREPPDAPGDEAGEGGLRDLEPDPDVDPDGDDQPMAPGATVNMVALSVRLLLVARG